MASQHHNNFPLRPKSTLENTTVVCSHCCHGVMHPFYWWKVNPVLKWSTCRIYIKYSILLFLCGRFITGFGIQLKLDVWRKILLLNLGHFTKFFQIDCI